MTGLDDLGRIRRAQPNDVAEILAMVRELAEFERLADHAVATTEQFQRALFGPEPKVFAHVVEHTTDPDHRLGGFALWFLNFSTWTGTHGIYLEDLYVRPHLRGNGYGAALLADLAKECVSMGYARLEWSVLDWNEDAIRFYRRLGAAGMDQWTVYRMSGDDLRRLADQGGS